MRARRDRKGTEGGVNWEGPEEGRRGVNDAGEGRWEGTEGGGYSGGSEGGERHGHPFT